MIRLVDRQAKAWPHNRVIAAVLSIPPEWRLVACRNLKEILAAPTAGSEPAIRSQIRDPISKRIRDHIPNLLKRFIFRA